ncbi:L-erythro-3,5-diaminohexanoate dehydrogenase [Anoxybacter fermentans]|uniref:L-erythro-3,5-diaminohexanoate dehydrogenase n=1 Tax=Anoxybacter fermentans TaxID=1323375 RepID=A0A3S9T199_9FIRM|nr:L-erythro-3,5-diaminohexanoate dehydrogenase [Anoxybacter fermentans]
MLMKKGCPYGTHRVIEPKGTLPQPAWKIDNTMEIYDNEILIDVQTLNIDSASFTQIKEEAGGDVEKIKARMMEIVEERGKHHNPVTGSGGMLIGRVAQIGEKLKDRDLKVGDRIATLVSLSLTPLRIDKIKEVRPEIDQVDIEGQAILFESGIYAKLPDDMSDTLALAVLDVAGAPAQTAKLVKPGDTVLIIGAGGKSGMLCLHEAKKRAGVTGTVIGMGHSDASCNRIRELGLADIVLQGDATRPVEVLRMVEEATGGKQVDVTINCVNIPDTEMASILPTRDGGIIYFFSMATSFTKAALGAEGVGKDVIMIIGNGYTKDHAEIALHTLRENQKLKDIFERLYG